MSVTAVSRKKTPEVKKEDKEPLFNNIDHNGSSGHRTSDESTDTDEKLGSSTDDLLNDDNATNKRIAEENEKRSSSPERRTSVSPGSGNDNRRTVFRILKNVRVFVKAFQGFQTRK